MLGQAQTPNFAIRAGAWRYAERARVQELHQDLAERAAECDKLAGEASELRALVQELQAPPTQRRTLNTSKHCLQRSQTTEALLREQHPRARPPGTAHAERATKHAFKRLQTFQPLPSVTS